MILAAYSPNEKYKKTNYICVKLESSDMMILCRGLSFILQSVNLSRNTDVSFLYWVPSRLLHSNPFLNSEVDGIP